MGKYKSFKPIGKIAIFVSIFLNEVHDMEIGINCIILMFVEQDKNNHRRCREGACCGSRIMYFLNTNVL